jgi:hypothetical protein
LLQKIKNALNLKNELPNQEYTEVLEKTLTDVYSDGSIGIPTDQLDKIFKPGERKNN